MPLPREVVPDRFLFLTRRCAQRQFFLTPNAFTNAAFLFCMMLAARLTGVTVILACAMSNHYHAVVYDREGRYPEFIEHFHRLLARVMNARLSRHENFWAAGQTSVIALIDREALMERLVYTAANPVRAGLVARASRWPGVNLLCALLDGLKITAQRPAAYFRADGKVPESLEFTPRLPPHSLIGEPAAFLGELRDRVEQREAAIALEMASLGKRVVGTRRVLAQSWRNSAATPEPKKHKPRCLMTTAELDELARVGEFRRAYRDARVAWREGNRDVSFPIGTYWLRVHACVRIIDEPRQRERAIGSVATQSGRSRSRTHRM